MCDIKKCVTIYVFCVHTITHASSFFNVTSVSLIMDVMPWESDSNFWVLLFMLYIVLGRKHVLSSPLRLFRNLAICVGLTHSS